MRLWTWGVRPRGLAALAVVLPLELEFAAPFGD
jgi:hypothetical protein